MSVNSIIETVNLPNKPGVYQFLNSQGEVIYIGKAKDLKKRVSSYFNRNQFDNAKLRALVSKVQKINHIIVETESDALLLENNLIKKLKPRYNILLKDDKTYPWICIKKEPFPRVFSTRRLIQDGSQYFGPYTSGVLLKTILDLIRTLYPIRTCNYSLTTENINSYKFQSCLEYQIGNCKAPCIRKQTHEEYEENIDAISQLLKGNIQKVNRILKSKMNENAKQFRFEEAQHFKEKLSLLQRFQAKSTIVSPNYRDLDVFSIVSEYNFACINYIKIIKGSIVQSQNLELKKVLNETEEDLLGFSIAEILQRTGSKAKEIVVPTLPDFFITGIKYTLPTRGDKLKLLELSKRNAKAYVLDKYRALDNLDPKKRIERILSTLQKDLRMKELPRHIECFDNSNLQGTNSVAACVVFRNAKPIKKEYRHYNIKSVTGSDDYASMEEVVFRRYKRLIDENIPIPQLIVIDGGKGQLTSAFRSLAKLGIENKVEVIGIAKRLEEIFFLNDPTPLYLDKNSESLKIIQNIRNEAHRFGIAHHRVKRSKMATVSTLESLFGIGEKTIALLYKHFKSYENISRASLYDLEKVVSKKRAQKVYNFFFSL
jgi:excinuclease ABC subunit C